MPRIPPPLKPKAPPKRRERRSRRWFPRLIIAVIVMLGFTEIVSFGYGWWAPTRTAFMLQDGEPIAYQYVALDHVSRYMVAATIAHEDQQLGTRDGAIPIDDFQERAIAYLEGKPDPSGSTIPQQLVKNIFLWPGPNAVRKGVEAVLATEFSSTLSSRRILELYLNYAQFGPHLYGICAASWYYFDEPPWHMSEYQSAQLMGVLPMPSRVRRADEGGIFLGEGVDRSVWEYVNGSANVHVPRQIQGMGGWEAAAATIGIFDKASDHVGARNTPEACSTMPRSVADRLQLETASH